MLSAKQLNKIRKLPGFEDLRFENGFYLWDSYRYAVVPNDLFPVLLTTNPRRTYTLHETLRQADQQPEKAVVLRGAAEIMKILCVNP